MTVRGLALVVLAVALLALAGLAWIRAEGGAPQIEAPESLILGQAGREVAFSVRDDGSGVEAVTAHLVHARGEAELVAERFPGQLLTGGAQRAVELRAALDAVALGVPEGSAQLVLRAQDWSWRANESELRIPVEIDRSPPRIRLDTGLTYVERGGAGSVAYRVSEATVRDGVQVGREGEAGSAFYRGFPRPGHGDGPGERVAIFAVERNTEGKPEIRVVAEDAAGNVARARWPVVVKDRRFPTGDVRLPGSFLTEKVPPLARAAGIDTSDPVAAFHRINTELRESNEKRIRELLADTAPEPLFQGAFQQLPGSKVTSRFAEARVYTVDGQEVSSAIHYGYDLASTRAAPITAANAGRVVFTGELGIYGSAVLLDHGLGVGSVYGHLSRIDVAAGDRVTRGEVLGLSGETGLAGGDHLHFAILVGETYVDPVEWWDPKWLASHVENRLTAAVAEAELP